MSRRTTMKHALVASLAISALTASSAAARPLFDRPDRFDSGPQNEQPVPPPGQPVWPLHPEPLVAPAPAPAAAATDDDGGVDGVWIVIGAGLAATGLAAGSAGLVRHNRVRARRVAA